MRILALEPFYGGSHRAFLDSWIERSRHEFTLLTLPATKWKWRMRHAAITFADQVLEGHRQGQTWDLVFATDMLNLAEFKGLIPAPVAQLPSVLYFHENQLTYPVRDERERDYHFAMSNIVSALAAAGVWFNTAWHRDTFVEAVRDFLARLPDHRLPGTAAEIEEKSHVHPPGIEPIRPRSGKRRAGPMRILWCARWEHDKGPEDFFEALEQLERAGVDYRLNVIGQQFSEIPAVFAQARQGLSHRIDHWGFVESRNEYEEILRRSDVVVSTAHHEFFGIAILEAISAGCYPLLPDRLSYPELLSGYPGDSGEFLYGGSSKSLADKLQTLAIGLEKDGSVRPEGPDKLTEAVGRYHLQSLVPSRDLALHGVPPGSRTPGVKPIAD
jgi:glycosyltransferase involved in cell wall biosynthesis